MENERLRPAGADSAQQQQNQLYPMTKRRHSPPGAIRDKRDYTATLSSRAKAANGTTGDRLLVDPSKLAPWSFDSAAPG
jgi:hypothetical protein